MRKIVLLFLTICLFSPNVLASECDSPDADWTHYSCWDYATGTSDEAIQDGVYGSGNKWRYDSKTHLSVVPPAQVPAGGPSGQNALKIAWPECRYPGCDSTNEYVVWYYPQLFSSFFSSSSIPFLLSPQISAR